MPRKEFDDTIIAVSTPSGVGGIGIVRLSGPQALGVARRIFKPRKAISRFIPLQAVLGDLIGQDGDKFDEAFLTYFKAPHSYTREDIVELSCHGSPAVLDEAIRLGVAAGARRAHPGEFTRRAVLRGRIDILQAEAVQSLISSESLWQAKVSYRQLEGGLSSSLLAFRGKIVTLLADIESRLEFPDEEGEALGGTIEESLREALDFVSELVASHDAGRFMTEGFTLAIVGRPNVGKSTLFNALSGKDRAIVTPYPGTTRDYLEERVRIGGATFNLIDMAGLGQTAHPIEKEGVKRGKAIAQRADGILFVVDASKKETRPDLALIRDHAGQKGLVIFNKSDLPGRIDKAKIIAATGKMPHVAVSALKGANIDELRKTIKTHFSPDRKKWDEIILHSRQKVILERIKDCLQAGLRLSGEEYGEEFCAEEVRKIIPLLGQLTGEIQTEEVLRSIFDRFCIGK